MLDTTIDMYKSTLQGVKKESTTVLPISVWNSLINESQEILTRSKAREVELTNKRNDDLEILRVVTDGVNGRPPAILPVATNKFPLPINLAWGQTIYPKYLSFLNVMFKLTYISNDCETGTSDWLNTKIMKSDNRPITMRNPYRKPKDNRLYYEIINGHINLITGTSSIGQSMRLEYLRKPLKIFLDVTLAGAMMADLPNPNYTANTGSVNYEFTEFQRQEVVDIAVRTYLERITDPRYKSFLNEEMTKINSK